MEARKHLSKGTKIAIILTIIGIIATIATVIGVFAANGAFNDGCPIGKHRQDCIFEPASECPCLTDEEEAQRHKGRGLSEKPIIYLYPESTTEVSVKLGYPDKLTASYPHYTDGWHVLAEPDGTLTDLDTDRQLYSLYWEGKDGISTVTDEGFIVAGSDIAGFLEEKLAILGLNAKEAEEFIIYWLPQLQSNPYNYIRFATAEEIESYMPLTITPTPDTIIRIAMIAKPLDSPITIKEQILPATPIRSGFTAVEWGGTMHH